MLLSGPINDIMDRAPALDAVRALLQENGTPVWRLHDVELMRVRIDRPSFQSARFVYKARCQDGADGDCYFFARTVPPALGQSLEDEINERFSDLPAPALRRFGKAALYCAELNLVLQVFPADRLLPALARAADGEFMESVLGPILHKNQSGRELVKVRPSLVQYEPEKKCLFRYALEWDDQRRSRRRKVVYGKLFRKARGAHATLERLHRASQGMLFRIPQPLAFLPDISMQLIGELKGLCLAKTTARTDFAELCRQAALGLVEFQRAPVVLDSAKGTAADLASFEQWGFEFAAALPGAANRIRALGAKIAKTLSRHTGVPLTLVHGDFNADNILVDGEQLGLLDFDQCTMGAPESDAGSFYGELKLLALKEFGNAAALDAAVHAFLDAYCRGCAAERRPAVIAYCALNCLWCAYFQCILRPSRADSTERALAMLRVGEEIMAKGLAA